MWYCYAISFLLHWSALSTYHKWLNKYFHKSTDNSHWFNWIAHGIGIGLAMFPFAWIGIAWWLILIRTIVLCISIMTWSELNDNAVWEECGRGVLIIVTLPILLYGVA